MRVRWWKHAILTELLLLGVSSGWAQSKLLTVSLKPYGWMSQHDLSVQYPDPERQGWLMSGPPDGVAWRGVGEVALDAQGHVYVGLPIWASGAAPKSAVRGTGDKLRVLVLNARGKGEVERTMDFPTQSLERLDLRLAGDGALLLVANDKLMRVGADGRPAAELALPDEEKKYEGWYLLSSTTGRTVRVRINDQTSMLVDAQTLAVLKHCQEPSYRDDTGVMTDDMELTTAEEGDQPHATYELERQVYCGKRERLLSFGDTVFVPSLVDDTHFLAIARDKLALRKFTGETVWSRRAPAGRSFQVEMAQDRLSRDGRRVAVRLLRAVVYQEPVNWDPSRTPGKIFQEVQFRRPGTRTVEIEDSIAVWEVASGRLLAQVPVQNLEGDRKFKLNSSFALSPDGRLLAVLQDGLLVLWKV